MATYPLKTLLKRWQREELTVEQVIGQIIQHLIALEKRLSRLGQPPKAE